MGHIKTDEDGVTIRLSRAELGLWHNALNEVTNGVHISDWEFRTRLGESRAMARELLTQTGATYRTLGDAR